MVASAPFSLLDGGYDRTNEGYVEVYEYINDEWQIKGQRIEGTYQSCTGFRVAINDNGNTIAVASVCEDYGYPGDTGFVRIYNFQEDGWVQVGNSIGGYYYGGYPSDGEFGRSLDLNLEGNIVAIGSPYSSINGGSPWPSGLVRVSQQSLENDNWQHHGY